MSQLYVGFSRIDITPMTGISLKGYFPMKDAYDEGGYEARTSNCKAGTAEKMIEDGLSILKEIGK